MSRVFSSGSGNVRGRLITLEGGEGAGKSSSLDTVASALEAAAIAHRVTREPGGTAFGESIRELLLDPSSVSIRPETELLLMLAARVEHVHKRILPWLEEGFWVVSDRFTDASLAYQGGGRRIDPERINWLHDWLVGELKPDLTLLLDVSVSTGLERARARGEDDRFESEKQSFHQRVRKTYLALAEAQPKRFHVIDASQSRDRVLSEVADRTTRFIEAARARP